MFNYCDVYEFDGIMIFPEFAQSYSEVKESAQNKLPSFSFNSTTKAYVIGFEYGEDDIEGKIFNLKKIEVYHRKEWVVT